MKKILNLRVCLAIFLAAAPFAGISQTIFFTDNFNTGSTTNGPSIPGGTPTASSTSYDIAATKTATASTIVPNDLTLKLNASTTSGFVEAQALFTTSPVVLSTVGDFIDITVVFTNTPQTNASSANLPVTSLLAGGIQSAIWIGLYDSGGGNQPVAGGLVNAGLTATAGSAFATGNAANWKGYASQITSNGVSRIYTRPLQNAGGTTSANQELLGNNIGGGAFNNPAATVIATTPGAPSVTLAAGGQYTLYYRITLTAANSLTISNSIFSGSGLGGTIIFSQTNSVATNTTFLTANFDAFSIGVFNKSAGAVPAINPTMDITSIQITGQSTIITTPPTITSEPVSVSVATNGAAAFTVTTTGFGQQYQWHRNNANLVNAGNFSITTTPDATSSTLVVLAATTADAFSSANGYYVTVTGTGGFFTNSVTNSLTLILATNLIWSGNVGTWDLTNSVSWQDTNGNAMVFNYGDPIIFDDTGAAGLTAVTLTGSYLSASSVTVNSTSKYTLQGSGSFAGPGSLIYINSGQLDIKNANPYSGGTIISNSAANLILENYNGLGTGPVTLAKAGGSMQTTVSGSASVGINGNIIVADDFTIANTAVGTFAFVVFGDLSGTTGKTLSIEPNITSPFTNSRVRFYGTNTVYNANLFIDGPATSQALYSGDVIAPYLPSGSQIYNGVISGNGGLVQRGNGTTILNGPNTYSGGTFTTAGTIAFGADTSPTTGTVVSGPIGTGPLFAAPEAGTAAGGGGTGTVLASGGARTIANPIQYSSGTNNLTLAIGGTNALTFTGPIPLQGQDNTATNSRIFQVTNTALTTFSGVISDLTNAVSAAIGLTKTGSGVLALNNTETYTGPTTNSAGILQINGSLAAASTVTVSSNATLSGTGTINGAVTVNTGGIFAPGTISIGTLTINNNLIMAGNINAKVNRSGLASDQAIVSGTLNNIGTGTITVTNLGATLQAGDTFTLFNKALTSGAVMTVSGAGSVWTNKLAIDGTIAVVSAIATTPTNIVTTVSGNTLTLSWPANYLGWSLQSNSVGLLSTTNWFTVANSSTATQFVMTMNPARTNVFYRMFYVP